MSKSESILKKTFGRDERGNVAIIFGLMAIPMVGMMGGAVDYARVLRLQTQLQSVADAGTLAGLRTYRTTGDKEEGEERMIAFFDAGFRKEGLVRAAGGEDLYNVTVEDAVINTTNSTANPKLRTRMKTPFLSVLGIEDMEVEVTTGATLAAKHEHGTKNLELSLMLDVSGSMADNGKIEDMKVAAKDFLEIVMPDDLAVDNRRVGLVPFSERVNVGTFASAATGLPQTRQVQTGTTTQYAFSTTSFSWKSLSSCRSAVRSTTQYSSYSNSQAQAYCQANFQTRRSGNTTQYYTPAVDSQSVPVYSTRNLRTCVTERQGSEAYTEASAAAGNYVGSYAPNNGLDSQYSTSGGCTVPAIKTLTTDRQTLADYIDTFSPLNGTAGHVGTAWSWYMLSPEWRNFWGAAQDDVADYSDTNTIKAAVIMTDGEYNSNYATASASAQAIEICNKMKDEGVTVYTIGFDMSTNVNDPARQTLMQCASPNKYYFPYDGTQLRQAFQEIGNSLVTIVTTNSDDVNVVIQK